MTQEAPIQDHTVKARRRPGPRTVVLVTLVLLVLAEITAGSLPGIPHSAVTVADPHLGFRKLPNQHFVGPRGVTVHINAEGYRDRDWMDPADVDPVRVAVLGQSMAYGAHVEIEETFSRKLEGMMQSRLDRAGDTRGALVMNFALPGYRLEQMVRAYASCAKGYRPDLVVVATTAHDIQVMPRAVQSGPGPVACWLKRRAIFRVASHLSESYVRLPALRRVDDLDGAPPRNRSMSAGDPGTVKRPFAPVQEPKWELARKAVDRLRQQVVEDGGELVILCLPMLKNVSDASLPHHAVIWADWAADKPGVRVLDGAPPLRSSMSALLAEMREKGRTPEGTWQLSKTGDGPAAALELEHAAQSNFLFFDPFHLSPRGHRVLAEWLDGQLAGWLESL